MCLLLCHNTSSWELTHYLMLTCSVGVYSSLSHTQHTSPTWHHTHFAHHSNKLLLQYVLLWNSHFRSFIIHAFNSLRSCIQHLIVDCIVCLLSSTCGPFTEVCYHFIHITTKQTVVFYLMTSLFAWFSFSVILMAYFNALVYFKVGIYILTLMIYVYFMMHWAVKRFVLLLQCIHWDFAHPNSHLSQPSFLDWTVCCCDF